MAFFPDLPVTATNAAARAADGLRWCCQSVTGRTEVKTQESACVGCDGATVHGNPATRLGIVVPFGEDPDEGVPATEKVNLDHWRALVVALMVMAHVHHPIPYGVVYNAGDGGNNLYSELGARIVSTSGSSMTLQASGWNPKRIVEGLRVLNPDWPPGDMYLDTEAAYALPVMCEVHFLYPSVLAGKLRPYVRTISMPASDLANATFTVTLSNAVNNAKQPYDAAYPPADGEYHVRLVFYQLFPRAIPNFQRADWSHWTKRTQTILSAAAASGPVELLNTASGSTRILWPDMPPAQFGVTGIPAGGGSPIVILDAATRLESVQDPGGAWQTFVDLQNIADDYDSFTVTFNPEALSGDSPTFPMTGRCANSQSDPNGDYDMQGGRRCTAIDAADKVGLFKAQCWQPGGAGSGCSHFCTDKYQAGNRVRPAFRFKDEALLGALITGCSLVLEQGNEGDPSTRNFRLKRPTNAIDSLMEFAGGWSTGAPLGKYPRRTAFYGPTFGVRAQYTDDQGANQIIAYGAFVLADDLWDAVSAPTNGVFPEYVSGWNTGLVGYDGAAPDSRLDNYPRSPMGTCGLYEFGASGASYSAETQLVDSEMFALNMLPFDAPNAAVLSRVNAIVNGTVGTR